MTTDRQQEIDAATPEAPVFLSKEEADALRVANKNRFQTQIGAGRYLLVPSVMGQEHIARMRSMLAEGYSYVEIGESMGVMAKTVEKFLETQDRIDQAKALKDKGLNNAAIAREIGLSENTVRVILR